MRLPGGGVVRVRLAWTQRTLRERPVGARRCACRRPERSTTSVAAGPSPGCAGSGAAGGSCGTRSSSSRRESWSRCTPLWLRLRSWRDRVATAPSEHRGSPLNRRWFRGGPGRRRPPATRGRRSGSGRSRSAAGRGRRDPPPPPRSQSGSVARRARRTGRRGRVEAGHAHLPRDPVAALELDDLGHRGQLVQVRGLDRVEGPDELRARRAARRRARPRARCRGSSRGQRGTSRKTSQRRSTGISSSIEPSIGSGGPYGDRSSATAGNWTWNWWALVGNRAL